MLRPEYPPAQLDHPPAELWEDSKGNWWCEHNGSLWRNHTDRYHRWHGTWADVKEQAGPLWKVPDFTEVA